MAPVQPVGRTAGRRERCEDGRPKDGAFFGRRGWVAAAGRRCSSRAAAAAARALLVRWTAASGRERVEAALARLRRRERSARRCARAPEAARPQEASAGRSCRSRRRARPARAGATVGSQAWLRGTQSRPRGSPRTSAWPQHGQSCACGRHGAARTRSSWRTARWRRLPTGRFWTGAANPTRARPRAAADHRRGPSRTPQQWPRANRRTHAQQASHRG